MAPSEPVFLATTPSGLWALDSVYRSAHRTVGTLVFLPEETLDLGTSKHYWVVSVRVNKKSIAHLYQVGTGFLCEAVQRALYP
jgi:hypothetical protein